MTVLQKIEFFRGRLNQEIENNGDFDRILGLSKILDEYIVQFTRAKMIVNGDI